MLATWFATSSCSSWRTASVIEGKRGGEPGPDIA
jgi:hypothetical protein